MQDNQSSVSISTLLTSSMCVCVCVCMFGLQLLVYALMALILCCWADSLVYSRPTDWPTECLTNVYACHICPIADRTTALTGQGKRSRGRAALRSITEWQRLQLPDYLLCINLQQLATIDQRPADQPWLKPETFFIDCSAIMQVLPITSSDYGISPSYPCSSIP